MSQNFSPRQYHSVSFTSVPYINNYILLLSNTSHSNYSHHSVIYHPPLLLFCFTTFQTFTTLSSTKQTRTHANLSLTLNSHATWLPQVFPPPKYHKYSRHQETPDIHTNFFHFTLLFISVSEIRHIMTKVQYSSGQNYFLIFL